jgi:hypothetical protein
MTVKERYLELNEKLYTDGVISLEVYERVILAWEGK